MKTPDLTTPKSIKWPLLCMQLKHCSAEELSRFPPTRYDTLSDPEAPRCEELRKAEEECMREWSSRIVDMRDTILLAEILKAATKAGITDLYLMDKQFVTDALREKLERDYYGKNA